MSEERGSGWKLRDVIMLGAISAVFGAVYLSFVYLGILASTLVSPLGLAVAANEPIFGVWFMASTFAAAVLRKPGAAILTEMLAALIEVLMGNMYGPLVLVSGFLQGLGAELAFLVFRYRDWSLRVMCLAACGACVFSFVWGFFRSGFLLLSVWLLAAMLSVRLLSSLFFAGWLSHRLAESFQKTGLFKSFGRGATPGGAKLNGGAQ